MFPGERRVWLAGAATAAVLLVVLAVQLALPRDYFTGTNSIRTRSVVAEVVPGSTLCVPDMLVPRGTARVEFGVPATQPAPSVQVEYFAGGERIAGRASAAPPGPGKLTVAIGEQRRDLTGQLCVSPRSGSLHVGGMVGLQSDMRAPTIDGRRLDARVALWFRPPAGERRSLASLLPDAFERAALFRPGWVGAWTYWVLLLAGAPLLLYGVLRLLARAFAGQGRRGALLVGAVAFCCAGSWSLVTPSLDVPDEPDHFAYVQLLGEAGKRPAPYPIDRPALSQEEIVAVDAVRLLSQIEHADGRPPWRREAVERWERRVRELGGPPLRRDDGGGVATAAAHSPAFYGLGAIGYTLAASDGASFWTELWSVRLISALLGALTAAFAYLFVGELLPGRRGVAMAAGLLVATFPMFSFIAGGVNNDNGVNAVGALSLWLAARALRRGLTVPLAVGLGVAVALLPLFKKTGFALYPAIGLAMAGAVWRLWRSDSLRPVLATAVALAASFGLTRVLWAVTGESIGVIEPPPPASGPVQVAGVASVAAAFEDPQLYLSYLWQTFFPRLPFMTDLWAAQWPAFDIYVKRGWGAFGWYAVTWPTWVYRLFVAVLVLVVAAAVAGLVQRRDALRTRWLELGVVVLAITGVLAAVAAAYVSPVKRDSFLTPEQGRYAFTCMAAFAAVAAWAIATRSRRTVPILAAVLVTGMAGLLVGSQLLAVRGFFT